MGSVRGGIGRYGSTDSVDVLSLGIGGRLGRLDEVFASLGDCVYGSHEDGWSHRGGEEVEHSGEIGGEILTESLRVILHGTEEWVERVVREHGQSHIHSRGVGDTDLVLIGERDDERFENDVFFHISKI